MDIYDILNKALETLDRVKVDDARLPVIKASRRLVCIILQAHLEQTALTHNPSRALRRAAYSLQQFEDPNAREAVVLLNAAADLF